MFYILTEGTSGADHVIGYFSKVSRTKHISCPISHIPDKEKISFDDYNLACIITFPPWQRKGFGMLMIEFSRCTSLSINFTDHSQVTSYLVVMARSVRLNGLCRTWA